MRGAWAKSLSTLGVIVTPRVLDIKLNELLFHIGSFFLTAENCVVYMVVSILGNAYRAAEMFFCFPTGALHYPRLQDTIDHTNTKNIARSSLLINRSIT